MTTALPTLIFAGAGSIYFGTDTERILDMSVIGIEYNTSRVKDELLISGAIKVNLLTVSKGNEISFFERQFDLNTDAVRNSQVKERSFRRL